MEKSAVNLRELGNNAVKNEKYEEAILHYTHAIKLEPTNYVLYSNRSLAFLKIKQYYYALEDANETIRLNVSWPKGYFRKGEVEFATHHYLEAINSYQKALMLKSDDQNIAYSLAKANQEYQKEIKADDQIPWLGAGIGIVIGVILVIADFVTANKPTHPVLMAVITISIAMVGYGLAKAYRYYIKGQKTSFIQSPIDLWKNEEVPQNLEKTSNRYTKSQTRYRYKKGKM